MGRYSNRTEWLVVRIPAVKSSLDLMEDWLGGQSASCGPEKRKTLISDEQGEPTARCR